MAEKVKLETATFGAGCFWGVEASFMKVPGVKETEVGYMGGSVKNPTDSEIYGGGTGHTEVVQLKYDSEEVNYEGLLDVFFDAHNPTLLNRQGFNIGEKYRSAIFYHNADQGEFAKQYKKMLDATGKYDNPITTAVEKASEFYRAEEYHQKYLQKRGADSCDF